jgi:hypothetical protein
MRYRVLWKKEFRVSSTETKFSEALIHPDSPVQQSTEPSWSDDLCPSGGLVGGRLAKLNSERGSGFPDRGAKALREGKGMSIPHLLVEWILDI